MPPIARRWTFGAMVAAASLGAGVLVASETVSAINPLYRFGSQHSREPAPVRPRLDTVEFTPIRAPDFAVAPDRAKPIGREPPRRQFPEFDLPPPEPVRVHRSEPMIAPTDDGLDLPPPITDAEIGRR